MAEASLLYLLEVLRSRDLPIDHEAIKSAFDDPSNQDAIRTWMQEYLNPETLLTHEEATL